MPEQAAERTEQPTPRRIEKAREEGNVPQSQEALSAATLLALVGAVALMAERLAAWATAIMREGVSCQTAVFADQERFIHFVNEKMADSIAVSTPIWGALGLAAIAGQLAVGGVNFAPGAVSPKLNALNPAAGIQNLINSKTIVQLIVSIVKFCILGIIVWVYLSDKTEILMQLRWAWSAQIIAVTAKIIFGLCIRICIALILLAIADTCYQKWKYIEDLKMTKQEVRQEHRDTEGAPEVKTRIRRIQLQMSMKRMLREVPKANVVLVNPTHVAVALRYEAKTMDAPIMVAKGADHLAEKIREIARAYGVPIVRRPELARTIYSTVQPGEPIPQNLYVAVAEILALLYRLRRRRS